MTTWEPNIVQSEGIQVEVLLAIGRRCRRCKQISEAVGAHDHYADLCDRCGDAVYEWDMHRFGESRPFVPTESLSPRLAPEVKAPYSTFGETKGYGHFEVCYTWDLEHGRRDPASIAYWRSGNMEAFPATK